MDWDIGMLQAMRSFSLTGRYSYRQLPHDALFVLGERDEQLNRPARSVRRSLSFCLS